MNATTTATQTPTVRLQAVGRSGSTPGAASTQQPLARRPFESNQNFGRRAIATAVLEAVGELVITWPHPKHEATAWLRQQVLDLGRYVESLPTRTYCGCSTYDGEVVTAPLHLWLYSGHLCDDSECGWSTSATWRCEGQAWADCQRCARTEIGPVMGIGSSCDRCALDLAWQDTSLVSATAGDVAVIARLCHACMAREGFVSVAESPR